MNILYIHYAGDFAEAYERLIRQKGKENYYGQIYSVNAVVQQARKNNKVMVLVLMTGGYRVELENNLITVGLNRNDQGYKAIYEEIMTFAPDKAILRTPDYKLLKILRKNEIDTFPVFADSFEKIPLSRLKGLLNKFLLARELKSESIGWIANHQLNAAISLQRMGVKANKILPWDWEYDENPERWRKKIPTDLLDKEIVIFYAGAISYQKGVFDLVHSSKYIKNAGRKIKIHIAGNGDKDGLRAFAGEKGVADCVHFMGLINHDEVLYNMNKADLVVVPSHHSYPEGLPKTLTESLMVHTPVVASDHPMFVGRVGLKGGVAFFKEKDPRGLSDQVLAICSDVDKYREMSGNAQYEWMALQLELKWADMINNWIYDPGYDFSGYSLECLLSNQ